MTETIASLTAIIGADITGLQAGLDKAKGGLSGLSASMRQTGAALTAGLTVPILGFLGASVKAASDNENALAQLDAALKSTSSQNGTFSESTAGSAKEIAKLSKELDTAEGHLDKLDAAWNSTTKHTVAQTQARQAAFDKMVDLNNQLNAANAITETSNTVVHLNRQAYIDLSQALSQTTRFSKDTVLSTEDLLLTFTSIGKDVFPDVTKAVLDMSQALGQDTKSSAIQLGKALQDPIKGVTALKRVGVEFTDAQINQIAALVKSGKTLEAQRIILKEIQKEFGGSAVAAGKTFAGQMDILNHSFTDFQEKVGYIIIPILESFMTHISDLVTGLNNLNPNILRVGIVAAVALAALGPVLGILGSIGAVIGIILSPIGLLVAAIAGLGVVIGLALTGQLPQFLKGLQSFVGDLVGKIGEFISTNAPKVVKAFEDLLGKVGDWLSSGGLGKLVIGLGDLMLKAANWFVTDGAPKLLEGIRGLFKAIQDFLGSEGWIKFRDGLLSVVKQAGDWIINTGWPLLKDSIGKLVELIIKALAPITQGIVNAVVNGVLQAKAALSGTNGAVTPYGTPPTPGGPRVDIGAFFPGFASGGFVGGPTTANLGENGPEYVVPSGGALIKGGGGPSTVHVIFQADGFTQHLYARIAGAMQAATS